MGWAIRNPFRRKTLRNPGSGKLIRKAHALAKCECCGGSSSSDCFEGPCGLCQKCTLPQKMRISLRDYQVCRTPRGIDTVRIEGTASGDWIVCFDPYYSSFFLGYCTWNCSVDNPEGLRLLVNGEPIDFTLRVTLSIYLDPDSGEAIANVSMIASTGTNFLQFIIGYWQQVLDDGSSSTRSGGSRSTSNRSSSSGSGDGRIDCLTHVWRDLINSWDIIVGKVVPTEPGRLNARYRQVSGGYEILPVTCEWFVGVGSLLNFATTWFGFGGTIDVEAADDSEVCCGFVAASESSGASSGASSTASASASDSSSAASSRSTSRSSSRSSSSSGGGSSGGPGGGGSSSSGSMAGSSGGPGGGSSGRSNSFGGGSSGGGSVSPCLGPCSDFTWYVGDREPAAGGPNTWVTYSPVVEICVDGMTSFQVNGASDDVTVMMAADDEIEIDWSGDAQDPVTFTLPDVCFIFRDTSGQMISHNVPTNEKTFRKREFAPGPEFREFTYPAGTQVNNGEGHVIDMQSVGINTVNWGAIGFIEDFRRLGWIGDDGKLRVKFAHIPAGGGFAQVTSIECSAEPLQPSSSSSGPTIITDCNDCPTSIVVHMEGPAIGGPLTDLDFGGGENSVLLTRTAPDCTYSTPDFNLTEITPSFDGDGNLADWNAYFTATADGGWAPTDYVTNKGSGGCAAGRYSTASSPYGDWWAVVE